MVQGGTHFGCLEVVDEWKIRVSPQLMLNKSMLLDLASPSDPSIRAWHDGMLHKLGVGFLQIRVC